MMDLDVACPHLSVSHETVPCPEHGAHDAWVCEECDEEFIPETVLFEAEERFEHTVGHLTFAFVRTRGYLGAAVALWLGTILGAVLL